VVGKAVCNELFGDTRFSDALEIIRRTGFDGVEIAPHTLFGDFSGDLRRKIVEIRRAMDGEGVAFAGFHWLLVGPADLHITTPEADVRRKSWDHIRKLADLAGELGGGPMTLGSPAQRSSRGCSIPQAVSYLIDGLREVAEHVASTGSVLLPEALPRSQSDVMNTLDETRKIIDEVSSPGVSGMFDFHNTEDEQASWGELIASYRDYLTHVHLNAPDGGVPGRPDENYRQAFEALDDIGYNGWISLEIFATPTDPEATLRTVVDFLGHFSV